MRKALRASARDPARFKAQARGGVGGGGKAASKMEDEEVAESWEEAADSGVRRSCRPAAGPADLA